MVTSFGLVKKGYALNGVSDVSKSLGLPHFIQKAERQTPLRTLLAPATQRAVSESRPCWGPGASMTELKAMVVTSRLLSLAWLRQEARNT